MNHDLTHLDLFSGIGGFKLAAERAGFRTVAFSEVEPYASAVLAERWPGTPNIGDVRIRSNFARFRGVTVLTGGFPCQPCSEAGQQRGEADVRWLWPATLGVVDETRPAWFIGENVPGLISMGLLDKVCTDLEGIGYSTQSFTIPACAAGAWHIRERAWILAHLDGQRESQPKRVIEKIRGRPVDKGKAPGATRQLPATTRHDTDAAGIRRQGGGVREGKRRAVPENIHADAMREGLQAGALHRVHREEKKAGSWDEYITRLFQWPSEPPLVRMVHGVPDRAHQIKALGNAIVPQVAEPFFQWISQIERGEITNL